MEPVNESTKCKVQNDSLKTTSTSESTEKSATTTTTTIATATITTTTTTTTMKEIPTISLSDGDVETPPVAEKISAAKKRPSLGVGNDENRLKRRKLRVAGAPKMPLTGYVRYMNERREVLRKDFPNKTAMEHTKMIGEEWQQLTEERKAPFMKAAAEDKERYTTELDNFLKLHPDILELERAKIKQQAKSKQEAKNTTKEKPEVNGSNKAASKDNSKTKDSTNTNQQNRRSSTPLSNSTNHMQTGEIPIFTNEFLEHNKIFDAELRALRKSKTDIEQQNAVLEKHVENMKFGVEKLTNENDNLQKKNRLLEIFLTKLKSKLATALSGLPIPTEPNGATLDNIDKYMTDLYKMATSNTHGPSLNKAKDVIRKLDLEIQL